MTALSVRDRVDAFEALGLNLYLDDKGTLRVRGPNALIAAAHPVLRQQRDAIVTHLRERPSLPLVAAAP